MSEFYKVLIFTLLNFVSIMRYLINIKRGVVGCHSGRSDKAL